MKKLENRKSIKSTKIFFSYNIIKKIEKENWEVKRNEMLKDKGYILILKRMQMKG